MVSQAGWGLRDGFGELFCEEHESLPLVLLVLRAGLPSGLTHHLGGFHTSAIGQVLLPAPMWVHFVSAKYQRTF